jgi:hypothetical protein
MAHQARVGLAVPSLVRHVFPERGGPRVLDPDRRVEEEMLSGTEDPHVEERILAVGEIRLVQPVLREDVTVERQVVQGAVANDFTGPAREALRVFEEVTGPGEGPRGLSDEDSATHAPEANPVGSKPTLQPIRRCPAVGGQEHDDTAGAFCDTAVPSGPGGEALGTTNEPRGRELRSDDLRRGRVAAPDHHGLEVIGHILSDE